MLYLGNWFLVEMAKRFKVGDSVVGKLISTMGKKATVLEVIVNGRRRKYVVRWKTGKVSTVSTNGICLARGFEPKAKCSRRKRARALEETEEASTLPASRFELDSSSVANAEEDVTTLTLNPSFRPRHQKVIAIVM